MIATGNLEIKKGETTATFKVETKPDKRAEASETFKVRLSAVVLLPEGVRFGIQETTATITDDVLTVNLVGPSSVTEGKAAEYTVRLTGGAGDEAVVVTYTLADSTATSADYTAPSGTVNIAAGETTATITIRTLPDDQVELGETLVVKLTEAETAAGNEVRIGTPSTATATIVDDSGVTISIEDPAPVAEGQSVTFTVTMSGTVAGEAVSLRYATADGTATAGQDYTAVADGTLTIAAGQLSATFTVATPPPDTTTTTSEDLETFTVTLREDPAQLLPKGVELGTVTATATIVDYALTATVTGPTSVPEGSAAEYTVALDGGANTTGVVVSYRVDGTASTADYTAPNGTLTIASGSLEGKITIQTRADAVLDRGETLVVTLTEATAESWVTRVGTPATATTTIVDDGSVTVSVAGATSEEGDLLVLSVTLSGQVGAPVTLGYSTRDGTATAADDYTAVRNGRLTITAGSTTASITVATTEDSDGEGVETFTVELSLPSPPDGVELMATEVTATITDDDIALLPVPPVEVAEGEVKVVVLMLERALQDPGDLALHDGRRHCKRSGLRYRGSGWDRAAVSRRLHDTRGDTDAADGGACRRRSAGRGRRNIHGRSVDRADRRPADQARNGHGDD